MSLIVKPISAMLVKDYDLITKMDPYVIIKIGNQKHKSKKDRGGGKNPKWTDTFQFQATGDKLMTIQVYDWDLIHDDFVGEGSYDLTQLYNYPMRTENQYIDVFKHGRSAGRVLLSLEYKGPNTMGQQPMYNPIQQPMYNPQQPYNQGNVYNKPPQQPPQQQNQGGWGNVNQPTQNWGNVPNYGYGSYPSQGWKK